MQTARGLVLGLFVLFMAGGCSQQRTQNPVAPPDTTGQGTPPRVTYFYIPPQAAVGAPVWMNLQVQRGTHPLSEVSVDFDGNGQADTAFVLTAQVYSFTAPFTFAHAGAVQAKAKVRDDHSLADSSTRIVHVLPCLFEIVISPASGIAPLQTALEIRHILADSFRFVRLDWTGDGTADTTFTPQGEHTVLWHRYPQVGNYIIRAEAQLPDTMLITTDTLQTTNTPPWGSLPQLLTTQDSTFDPVELERCFYDQQTPSPQLEYAILEQHGPAVAEIRDHILYLNMLPGQDGNGNATIRVSDPDGGFVDALQEYVIGQVFPMTDIWCGLVDIETGDTVRAGILTINRRAYAATEEQPMVHAHFWSLPQIEVAGFRGVICGAFSFEANYEINGQVDSTFTLPLVTFSELDTALDEQFAFHDLNAETRDLLMPNRPTGEGLAGFDFATISHDTIWIAPVSHTGQTLAAAEQDQIESLLNAQILPALDEGQRPVVYRALDSEPVPWQVGYGPSRNGLILVEKAANNDLTVYDAGQDGSIERALVSLADVNATQILRGVLRALAAPQEVTLSVTPEQSILHPQSTLESLSVMDRKLLHVASKIPPGSPYNNIFRFPA